MNDQPLLSSKIYATPTFLSKTTFPLLLKWNLFNKEKNLSKSNHLLYRICEIVYLSPCQSLIFGVPPLQMSICKILGNMKNEYIDFDVKFSFMNIWKITNSNLPWSKLKLKLLTFSDIMHCHLLSLWNSPPHSAIAETLAEGSLYFL